MNRLGIIFALVATLLITSFAFAVSAQNVAITYKIKGTVELVKSGSKSPVALTAGTHLSDGDRIKTGKDGYCFIIFVEDKTQLKIRENSNLTITANRNDKGIEQQVNLDIGKIWSQVTKEGSNFKISTPTSVASVKGTMWWTLVDENGNTQIIGLAGIVNLLNRATGNSADIGAGVTGTSGANGIVNSGPTVGSIPNPEGTGRTSSMRIPYHDAEGNLRYLTIEFDE